MTQLSDFISLIKRNNIARTNRFRVHFTLPERVELVTNQDVERTLSLTCLIADVPGVQQQTSTVNYGNYDRRIVHGRSTNDFTTTFLMTGLYLEKRAFDAWHRIINDESQRAVEFYDNYIASILVECLNEQDEVMYSFELTEAYPLTIGNLRLDRTAQNQQMVLDVNWAYHRVNYFGNPDENSGNLRNIAQVNVPPVGVPGIGAGKLRLLPIPGIDQMSAAVQSVASIGSEFRGQLQGVLDIAKDVREQVRDFKMEAINGVKILNGVIKDVKAINGIPADVKNEVVSVVTDTRNQIGYAKDDLKNINNYPKR